MRCFKLLPILLALAPSAFGQTLALYTQPQQLVALPDGRRINLYCEGSGAPTVILTSGLDNWSISWSKVEGAVAQNTRVCAWDRAGFGFSDPSAEPQDAEHTLADLEGALRAAGIAGPYILVSQSAGSYESLLFADRRPAEVAGLVLVDPSIPGQPDVFASVSPAVAAFSALATAAPAAALRKCAAALQSGALSPGGADPDKCFAYPPDYPDAVKAALARLDADPKRLLTKASREEEFAASAREVVNPRRNYGALPLVVLTAETLGLPATAPPALLASEPALRAQWLGAHDALAALSTAGVNHVVEGSGHAIPVQKPEAVVAAIDSVIAAARAH